MIISTIMLAVAGGLGAAARFLIDGLVRTRTPGSFPFGTMIINLGGSLLLGLLAGLVSSGLPSPVQIITGTGFLGGYTTFSSASVETLRLMQERRWAAVIGNGLGMLVLGSALALLGLVIGRNL
jgi:CrcB protein